MSLIKYRSNTKIVISSILLRPVDHLVNGDKIIAIDNKLKELCKTRNIKFLHSYRPFTKARKASPRIVCSTGSGSALKL